MLYGVHAPFWLALALLTVVQMLIAVYGHHMVQIISKYMGYVLMRGLSVCSGIRAMRAGRRHSVADDAGFFVQGFRAGVLARGGEHGGLRAPYAADYTRYLPPKTSKDIDFL